MNLPLPGTLVDSDWLHTHLGHPALIVLDASVDLPSPVLTVITGWPAVMTVGCARIFPDRDMPTC